MLYVLFLNLDCLPWFFVTSLCWSLGWNNAKQSYLFMHNQKERWVKEFSKLQHQQWLFLDEEFKVFGQGLNPKTVFAILTYLVPIAIMICCFSLTLKSVRRMNRRIQRTDPLQNQSSVIERKIESLNKLAFLDCTIFTLVHLPFAIARSLPGSENHEIDTISNITMWIGSCIYPFIYISHWPNLKQNWKKFLGCCKSGQSGSYEMS